MRNKIIGLAGASGAGKSTVAFALTKKYADKITLLQLDDYFRKKKEVPLLHGMKNWDDPRALNFEKLLDDLLLLSSNQPAVIRTKSELYNPDYPRTDTKIYVTVEPNPIILLEGFMALWHPQIRELFTTSIFLDMSAEASLKRRKRFETGDYTEKILMPMIAKYVRPTKIFANHVIDVSTLDAPATLAAVQQLVLPFM